MYNNTGIIIREENCLNRSINGYNNISSQAKFFFFLIKNEKIQMGFKHYEAFYCTQDNATFFTGDILELFLKWLH